MRILPTIAVSEDGGRAQGAKKFKWPLEARKGRKWIAPRPFHKKMQHCLHPDFKPARPVLKFLPTEL